VAGLDGRVAERQSQRVVRRLREMGVAADATCVPVPARRSRGCHVLVVASFERTRSGHGGVAAEGVEPDRAGDAASGGFASFMGGRAAVDPHLGDQLLLPAALVAARRIAPPEGIEPVTTYSVAQVTRHLLTNAEVIRRFLDVAIEIRGEEGQEGEVRVAPAGS
jgi:RNA 3'-terminal phosphate cyclase (ATP)